MSLTVLLADDEPLFTQAARILISETGLDIEIVGELHDGDSVLKFISMNIPDVIFLDIRMPYKNGFQILEEIERHNYETKVIILSAHRDFEYAQKALHFGAVEYLTKPINKASLASVLYKLIRLHDQEKITHSATASYHLDLLLQGGTVAREQFAQWDFFGDSPTQNIQLGVLFFTTPKTYEDYKNFNKRKGAWAQYLSVLSVNEYYWIFIYKAGAIDALFNIKKLSSALDNGETYIGLSTVVDCSLFPIAYNQAMVAVQHSFYTPLTTVYLYSEVGDMPKNGESPLISESMSAQINEKIQLGMEEELEHTVHIWFDTAQQKYLHPSLVCTSIIRLLAFIRAHYMFISKELDAFFQERSEYLTKLEVTQNYTTSAQLEQWTINTIIELSKANQDLSNFSDKQRIIEKAKNYCERHYKEDISLDSVAQEVHITKSWFCSIFKAETGQTFGNYLTDLRLQKATVLLSTSEIKINIIAKEVGYKNPSHFNHAFVEKYKVTPLEYRRTHWNHLVG